MTDQCSEWANVNFMTIIVMGFMVVFTLIAYASTEKEKFWSQVKGGIVVIFVSTGLILVWAAFAKNLYLFLMGG